ncbi:MAG: gamma-glutamyl-gamma-aminobutyrate hydrolase family protein [Clostridia bacterium]|nr:gamma-glutamyl-gamma-aminobutyrate hydrolase family protein [Clostridia bacterium]MBQ3076835.1 gamma-glutamyl-gamma-aminobutyrate hydrolase family protein [Clostridia bacterium]
MKKIVGIVPSARLFETDDPYQDRYTFINSYALRLAENGGAPIGLLSQNGRLLPEPLELTDALLICGGTKILPFHFEAVDYAVRSGKPLLGVCLGMQVIHAYFLVADEAGRRGYEGPLLDLYEQMKKERHMFVLPVEHHWDVPIRRGQEEAVKHPLRIAPGSLLHRLLGQDEIRGASMHHYRVNNPSPRLTRSAHTADGTIEALEYGEQILGIQFHPEVDSQLDPLFRFLTR